MPLRKAVGVKKSKKEEVRESDIAKADNGNMVLVETSHYERLAKLKKDMEAISANALHDLFVMNSNNNTAEEDAAANSEETERSRRNNRGQEITRLIQCRELEEDLVAQSVLERHRPWTMKMRTSGDDDLVGVADGDDEDIGFSSDDDDAIFAVDQQQRNGVGDEGAAFSSSALGPLDMGVSQGEGEEKNTAFAQRFLRQLYKESRRTDGWRAPLNEPFFVKNTAGEAQVDGSSLLAVSNQPSKILADYASINTSALGDSTSVRNFEKRMAKIRSRGATLSSSVGGGGKLTDTVVEVEGVLADYDFSQKLRGRSQKRREDQAAKLGQGAGDVVGINAQNVLINKQLTVAYRLNK